jgi:glyoxylase-like metal-dependent hydrolase (beta-lactamase superfamily II)
MVNESFQFRVGRFTCLAIRDGDDWDRNVLLVSTGQHLVLIDTGNGDTTSPPGLLMDRLRAAGISATDIDIVVLTHADFDHIGGATDAHGRLEFPQARYVLSHDEWTFWEAKPERLHPNAAYDEAFRQFVQTVGETRLAQLHGTIELIDMNTTIVPGIRSIAAPGHTPGYVAIVVSSDDEHLLFIGDLIRDPKDIENPDWYSVFDFDPAQVVKTQHQLLTQAVSERMLVMAYHIPFPGLGYVTEQKSAWRWMAYETSNETAA